MRVRMIAIRFLHKHLPDRKLPTDSDWGSETCHWQQ
jgi:hypothetical protein